MNASSVAAGSPTKTKSSASTNDIGGRGNIYRFGTGEIREIRQSASTENLNRVADVAQRNF